MPTLARPDRRRHSLFFGPHGATTRLLRKIVMKRGGAIAPLVSIGELVMARRQLLNLRRLAERTAATRAPSDGGR